MECPKCAHSESDVIDSRGAAKAVRRRRQCGTCTYRFTTYERVERPRLMVVKKDQRREPFMREKLIAGIERACEKREVSKSDIESLVDSIECELYDRNDLEITTQEIGERVMKGLVPLDPVAYVRFASVYQEFSNVTAFANVIEMLEKE